jgi:hypothetical protein
MVPDSVLIKTYGEVMVPADQLLTDTVEGDRYLNAIRQKTTEPIDRRRVLGRVLTLRKMGRLPRLRRKRGE